MFTEFEQKFLELLKEATKQEMKEVVNKLGEINESNDKELKVNLDQLFKRK